MTRSQRSEAIILRSRDYGESDRLLTFVTPEHGKLTGIAKGARRSKKRFVHTLEPLSAVIITFVERPTSGLVRIDASELLNPFAGLRQDLLRLGYASLGCEVVLELLPERDPHGEVFTLLSQFLHQAEKARDPEGAALLFLARFLGLTGYQPQLHSCKHCRMQAANLDSWIYSVTESGIYCPSHRPAGKTYRVSPGTVLLLQQALRLPLTAIWRLAFHPRSLAECRDLLIDQVRYHLQKELNSLKMLRQLAK